MKLHHFAYNISPNSLEIVLEEFNKMGCNLSYREKNARWCMIEQKPIPIDIQLIETKNPIVTVDKKISTHIAFLSDTPQNDVDKIKSWAKEMKINFSQGSWSDKELWFDLPEIFVNFVVEIMHTDIVS